MIYSSHDARHKISLYSKRASIFVNLARFETILTTEHAVGDRTARDVHFVVLPDERVAFGAWLAVDEAQELVVVTRFNVAAVVLVKIRQRVVDVHISRPVLRISQF